MHYGWDPPRFLFWPKTGFHGPHHGPHFTGACGENGVVRFRVRGFQQAPRLLGWSPADLVISPSPGGLRQGQPLPRDADLGRHRGGGHGRGQHPHAERHPEHVRRSGEQVSFSKAHPRSLGGSWSKRRHIQPSPDTHNVHPSSLSRGIVAEQVGQAPFSSSYIPEDLATWRLFFNISISFLFRYSYIYHSYYYHHHYHYCYYTYYNYYM